LSKWRADATPNLVRRRRRRRQRRRRRTPQGASAAMYDAAGLGSATPPTKRSPSDQTQVTHGRPGRI
jgi:hypothetical protein